MAISHIATTSADATSSGTTLVCDKPSGTTTNDFMVAFAAVFVGSGASAVTFTQPSGWTKVREFTSTGETYPVSVCVMTKKATGSEGSNYTFTFGTTNTCRNVSISTYRGATGAFIAENAIADSDNSSPMTTPTLSNTQSTAWRTVCTAGVMLQSLDVWISSSESTRRFGGGEIDGPNSRSLGRARFDSGGSVATGSTNRTVSLSSGGWDSMVAWIGLIQEGAGTPATGTWESTLPKVVADADGEVHNDGTLASTIPKVVASLAGEGQPIPGQGVIAAPVPAIQASMEGGEDVSGSVSASVLPSVSFVGETRQFGVRVIMVEADDRTIRVESRGVAD